MLEEAKSFDTCDITVTKKQKGHNHTVIMVV